jgi:hypothetical protein
MLLLNDLVLKAAFANWLTGKLSDVAGLFVVVVLGATLHSRRAGAIALATAAAFVVWKSPASQPAIDLWNQATGFTIARVVDASDLVALAVVPLARRYAVTARRLAPTVLRYPIVAASLLAILGTSKVPPGGVMRPSPFAEYSFTGAPHFDLAVSRPQALDRLRQAGFSVRAMSFTATVLISLPVSCPAAPGTPRIQAADVELHGSLFRSGSRLRLHSVTVCRGPEPLRAEELLAAFHVEMLEIVGPWRERLDGD